MSNSKRNKRRPEPIFLKKNGPRTILPGRTFGADSGGNHHHNPRRDPRRNPRKANPGILSWIVDFFVRPIESAIKGLVSPILEHPTPEESVGLEASLEAFRKALFHTHSHSSLANPGLTPASEKEALESWARAGHKNSELAWVLCMATEAASFGQLDITLEGFKSLPVTRAYYDLIASIFKAEFEIGRLPYLQRHWNQQYTPLLPGYADMISIYVKEGHLAEKWVEIPDEFKDTMKELGYSEDWTLRLWGKKWVLPGVELLYDMFHKKIIDYETMALMLKYHDFEPVWRHRLIENAYTMIPRVDLRRAYMYAVPGYEDLVEPYEKLGYSSKDAATMDAIAKRFALARYYTRLETVARAAYRKRRLSEAELTTILRKVNTPAAAIPLIIEAEALARGADVVDPGEEVHGPSRTDMRWMVEWALRTPSELTAWLIGDGMAPEEAPDVAEAYLLNQLREELGKVRRVYENKLREGFMDKAAFAEALEGIHCAPHVVDTLIVWAEEELDLAERKEIADEYEKLAKEGVISPEDMGAALRKLGMVEDRITRMQNHVKTLLEIKAFKAAPKEKA